MAKNTDIKLAQVETIFDNLVKDYLNQKISDIQFGNLTGDLFYGKKITHEIEGDLPELANLMTMVSEFSWDKQNLPNRYEQTRLRVIHYAKKKFII